MQSTRIRFRDSAAGFNRRALKRTLLAAVMGACLFQGAAFAQSTSGGIYGTAPAGGTVTVTNQSGFSRTATVGADGRYNLNSLPIGSYVVDAGSAGKKTVTVTVGGSADVSFDATTLDTVTVTGASVPKIDVTSTDTRSVITAEQLQRLPMGRSAEAIALLAPGVAKGNGYYFGKSVSLGGASVAENAYYINGYFVGNPMTNVGGYTLPYGSIDQQQTLTGGYGAEYGRSDGGVINQIGKSGTNELHFGGQVTYSPKGLRSTSPDQYYPNQDYGSEYTYAIPSEAGTLYKDNSKDKTWESTYSGYISGPIIKDTLFAFVSAETTKTQSYTGATTTASPVVDKTDKANDPKIYAKLNWNINDDNLLEYTYMGEKYTYEGYGYNETTGSAQADYVTPITQNNETSVLKYTSYITDDLSFDATYGRSRQSYRAINPLVEAGNAYVYAATGTQNPDVDGYGNTGSNNTTPYSVNAQDYTHGLRAALHWTLGDHTITAGIDDMKFEAENEGQSQTVDSWTYSHTSNYSALESYGITEEELAAANGYYVRQQYYNDAASMSLKQTAYYLQDEWQVTDNFKLSIGLRDDKFVNYNNAGEAYVDSGNQWAPRFGATWDVFGDSSLKLFANAGRYFLALPNAVAVRGASSSVYSRQYSTYTSIASDGTPQGLTSGDVVYLNSEDGSTPDPATIAASNLESEYQDEYKLGFEKTLGDNYVYGANVVYRDLKQAVDDICDPTTIYNNAVAQYGQSTADGLTYSGCYLANPSTTDTFKLANSNGGYTYVTVDPSDWGWPSNMKRTYKALNLFLEHPFDGKWEARIDYTWSSLKGNTEGPANSDTGQGSNSHDNGVSTSENWDIAALMAYADGYLANNHKHQIKAHGSYAFNGQWSIGATVTIMSGAPANCFGYYNPDGSIDENSDAADPAGGYGSSYHTCFGSSWAPGTKTLPWTHSWDVGVNWSPAFYDHKLKLGINVFNLFDSHGITSIYTTSETAAYTVSNTYGMASTYQAPRYVQFSAAFDY